VNPTPPRATGDGAHPLREGGWFPLDRARFRITGADRVRFLNGQVSNDVRKLRPGEAMRAAVMSAKGKICADVFMRLEGDAILLDTDPAVRGSLPPRLERYVVADDVAIEDIGDLFSGVHLFGAIPADTPDLPGTRITASRVGVPGIDLVAPRDRAGDLDSMCREKFGPPMTGDAMDLLQIERGLPSWGTELDEEIMPIEAGIENEVVDFFKGCYLGQEIVSRVHGAGHANRSLRGLITTQGTPLAPDLALYPDGDPAREVGRITRAAHHFGLDRWVALAYVRRGWDQPGTRLLAADAAGIKRAGVEIHAFPLYTP